MSAGFAKNIKKYQRKRSKWHEMNENNKQQTTLLSDLLTYCRSLQRITENPLVHHFILVTDLRATSEPIRELDK